MSNLNIRYEGYSINQMYIAPSDEEVDAEFVKNMNEKVAELKEWVDKNSDSDNFDDDFFEKRLELGEWIGEKNSSLEIDFGDEFTYLKPEGELFVNDEEFKMGKVEKKYFYYGEEKLKRFQTLDAVAVKDSYEKQEWYIHCSHERDLILEYESDDEELDESKLKWDKEEGGLIYEDGGEEYFEDNSGGESNGDEDRIWKVKIKGIDYFGNW